MMKRYLLGCLLILVAGEVFSQTDTTRLLDFETYMEIVAANHPVAMQADLQLVRGDAYLRKARGAFDPKTFLDARQKDFDGKRYYDVINGGLKIPTWFGIELTTAYEQTSGTFLDPESTTPDGGLWYAGISMPIGRGLFIDQRRAELKQAKLYLQATRAEQQLILNDLFFKAGKAYWEWFQAYNVMLVFDDALNLATVRFQAVSQSVDLGDRPAIDTLEASIQVQNRRIGLQQAQLDFANATAMLSVFLWANGELPLEIAEGTVPPRSEDLPRQPLDQQYIMELDSLVANHPYLQQYRLKIGQLNIDQRLKREQLKPVLNLKYNAISQPVGNNPFAAYSPNNYTWGVEFGFPLFLRKERGALQLAKVKVQEAELDFDNKQAKLLFEANASLNDWSTTDVQIGQYTRVVADYRGLLEGERQMFTAGESSLFMVNSREQKYIEAQVKLMEVLTKNRKANLATEYALGLLSQ
jgi:outer membrane protein TolC